MPMKKQYAVFSIVFIIIAFVLRALFALPLDPLLSFAVIEFAIFVVAPIKPIKICFRKFGENSANIWLIQALVLNEVYIFTFANSVAKFFVVSFVCLCFAICLDQFKKSIHYNYMVKRLRSKLI